MRAVDIQNKKEIDNAINGLSDEFKDIDILVNNVGVLKLIDHPSPFY